MRLRHGVAGRSSRDPTTGRPGPLRRGPTERRPTLEQVLAVVPPAGAAMLPAFPGARHSAVLIVLADSAQGPEVLLTRRSWELRNHKGEVSFPGGRMDPGETPSRPRSARRGRRSGSTRRW